MDDKRRIDAIAVARRQIARRLARICSSLSPEEFEKLLDRMAGIQWKYDMMPHTDLSQTSETAVNPPPLDTKEGR